ncbi:MAG: hypothetical protein ACRDSN_24125, partial [Pseudonocardiaceae bacterium]
MPETGTLRELRAEYADWTLYRRGDEVLGLPSGDQPHDAFGEQVELRCEDQLGFLSFLINDALPRHIQRYHPYRRRPYTILGRRQELVGAALRAAKVEPTSLLRGFEIRPKYVLEARLVELRDDHPFLGVFVDIST